MFHNPYYENIIFIMHTYHLYEKMKEKYNVYMKSNY